MAKKRRERVKDLKLWLDKIDSENVPEEEWNPNPKMIYDNYIEKNIDKEMGLYILKVILYNREDTWNNLSHRKNCLKYIVEISDKNKELRSFLEDVFIVEHWFPLRIRALQYLTEYFPKLAFTLFNHISNELGYNSFLNWTLNKTDFEVKDIEFLLQIVKDKLVALQISLKENIYAPKINLLNRTIKFRETEISLVKQKEFRRFSLLKELNDKEILSQTEKYFIWKNKDKDGVIYEFDLKKTHPILILQEIEKGDFKIYYGVSKKEIQSVINAIKETYELKQIEHIKIIKTSVIYIMLEIMAHSFFMKAKLGEYRVRIKDEKKIIQESLIK